MVRSRACARELVGTPITKKKKLNQSVLHFVFKNVGDDKVHIGLKHHVRDDKIKMIRQLPQNEVVAVHDGVAVRDAVEKVVTKGLKQTNLVPACILDGDKVGGVEPDVDAGGVVGEVGVGVCGDGDTDEKVVADVDGAGEGDSTCLCAKDAGVVHGVVVVWIAVGYGEAGEELVEDMLDGEGVGLGAGESES